MSLSRTWDTKQQFGTLLRLDRDPGMYSRMVGKNSPSSFQGFHFSISWRDTSISSNAPRGANGRQKMSERKRCVLLRTCGVGFWGSYGLLIGVFLDMRADRYL